MALPSFCCETVEVLRAPLASSRGTSERDWSAAEPHEVAGCCAQYASTSSDRGEPRDATSDSATLYAPPGSDVREGDRVSCSLGTFAVEGTPMPLVSPTGAVSHLEVSLARWRG